MHVGVVACRCCSLDLVKFLTSDLFDPEFERSEDSTATFELIDRQAGSID